MRYIRLNNDVKIKWEILRNTDPEVFTNKDITVKLFSKCGCEQPISYTIVDNKIFIDYFGKDQRETGSYRLCLIENDGKTNMATLDYVDCFTLSKTLKNQTSTGSDSSSSLKTEVIELSSKINTTGVEYVGGDGIDVVGSVISVDDTVARTDKLNELEAKVDTKADENSVVKYLEYPDVNIIPLRWDKPNFIGVKWYDNRVQIGDLSFKGTATYLNGHKLSDLIANKAEKTELPDVSIYNPTNNFKTINGNSIIGTGDVVIEVPNNLSQLNNDMDYVTRSETVDINTYNQHVENQSVENTNFNNNITELQNNKADKAELPDVSIYNPTDNFKTINGESIIGTGNIEIQGGGGGSEDKMDKHHPIFTETISSVGINPDFRLHGYITYADYNGTFNDNCVERYWSIAEMYVRWDLQAVQNYLNDNADTKYAAVKGFCRADSSSFGNCKYLLFIENTETGVSEQIDQYLLDNHVYGAIGESNNITGSSMPVADSRDPNDIISAIISNSIGNTSAFYIRNGVMYNCPYQMYQCDTAFNTNMSIPYMTTLIDIKGIINNYNISDYNRLTVKIVTEDTTHWHIMSSNLFFTNDTDFITGGETTKEYVLIDELNKKAEKDNLKTINNQSIIGTGNIEIQGGSGDITASGDNTFNGTNTFNNLVYIYNSLYYKDPRDSNYTSDIFSVLTEGHTSQTQTYNNMDAVYESGKKLVWSEEQNKAIIVEDANYNIKYCSSSVYSTINYVYDVTNGYEAFWWNGQYAENGVDKIIKKVDFNTSPSNEYVHEFYVNVSVDYTEDVNVYYYIEAQYQSYLEGSGFIKDAPFDGNQYVRQNGNWTLVQGGSGDITASGDNTFNGTNVFNNTVSIYSSLYCKDPRDNNYTYDIFSVLTEGHTSQTQTYNNIDSLYESGKKLVWSEEQNKVIIVEDANYNIKYCNVYNTINYVDNVTNGYEAFWWNGQYTEDGLNKILKKVDINTSPSNEFVYEFYVNVPVDYTEYVNVFYYYEAQYQSYLEGSGFIKDAPQDDKQYVRKNGLWTTVQGGSSAVTSVNGATGDVVIDIPTNVSQLNNDAGYLTEHQDLSNYATKTELTEYNKTNNFKTVNGQSIIGTGNIEIQGGSGADKMDKHHPIFNETYVVDEINPDFRLSGYVDKIETQGTTNYNCVERWHSVDNLWVRWSLESIQNYLNNNTNTKYAAVKGFCLPSSEHVGECEYHLFIENTSTGLSEQIDQYMQDRHVYGDYYESKNITLNDNAIVDSRDPNDNIIGALNQAIGTTTGTRFIRNSVTYYTPDNMSNTNVFLNDNYTLPYMTSIIDIKGILENYSIDTYTSLRVQMKTTQITHWHIMSCYLFFSNDTEFMKHSETSVDYVLIDELTQKATKTDLNDYNKTNNFKTINNQSIIGTGNIEIQGGSSAVTSVNGQTGDVTIEIPTNVSQLNNDAGYLTEHQDLSNYATTEFVNTATNNGHIVWTGTQAEYDALSDKTVYLIYLIKKG